MPKALVSEGTIHETDVFPEVPRSTCYQIARRGWRVAIATAGFADQTDRLQGSEQRYKPVLRYSGCLHQGWSRSRAPCNQSKNVKVERGKQRFRSHKPVGQCRNLVHILNLFDFARIAHRLPPKTRLLREHATAPKLHKRLRRQPD